MSRYSLFISLIAVFGLGLALSPTTKGQARLPHTFTSTVTVTQTARRAVTQTATLTARQTVTQTATLTARRAVTQTVTQTATQTAAQTGAHAGVLASTSTGVRIGGLDHNIQDLRNNAVPNFHYKYDDYLQYAPAALMLGLKACGVEGQTPWVPMLVADACSAGIMAIAVNGIKYTVGRLRPDGSRYNSFPSGHTATAFLTATLLHKEYGHLSPWYSIGGYTAAAITGVSRILNNRHWLSDVMTGAAIGIGSVHLGYYLTELMFPKTEYNTGFETITPPQFHKIDRSRPGFWTKIPTLPKKQRVPTDCRPGRHRHRRCPPSEPGSIRPPLHQFDDEPTGSATALVHRLCRRILPTPPRRTMETSTLPAGRLLLEFSPRRFQSNCPRKPELDFWLRSASDYRYGSAPDYRYRFAPDYG